MKYLFSTRVVEMPASVVFVRKKKHTARNPLKYSFIIQRPLINMHALFGNG